MNIKKKHTIRILLVILVSFAIIGTFVFNVIPFSIGDLDFQTFALMVTIGYDMLPTVAQQFSIGATITQLLQSGFNPFLLAIISTGALLGGQMILYVIGMFIRKVHKGSFGDLASKNHFLHEHHFLIYLVIPFVGILGDAVMIYSGHQRINPVKIIPFLAIANFVSALRWILPAMGQLQIGSWF